MGLYDAFRQNGAPTFYEAVHIPVEADLVVSGLVFCFVILAASFFLVLPGIRGKEVSQQNKHFCENGEKLICILPLKERLCKISRPDNTKQVRFILYISRKRTISF